MSLHPRPAGLLAVSAVLLTGLTALAAPAGAAEGSAPVTVDDELTLSAGDMRSVDVLANDSDPDGDELAVCRLSGVPRALHVMEGPDGEIAVGAPGRRTGTWTITYHACDFDYLTPATLTVTVVEPAPVRVTVSKLPHRPGRLKVVNRSGFPVRFLWGSVHERRPDGAVRVRAKAVVIPVRRRSLIWVASAPRHTTAHDRGVVRRIALPPGAEELPPGAPQGHAVFRTARTWR